jgi:hypothetical protein
MHFRQPVAGPVPAGSIVAFPTTFGAVANCSVAGAWPREDASPARSIRGPQNLRSIDTPGPTRTDWIARAVRRRREGKLCPAVRPEAALQRSAEAWGCAGSRITFPDLANPPGGGQRLVGLQSAIGVLAKRRRRGATVTQAGLPRAATGRREAGANWRPFASCKAEYRTRATMEHSCTGYLGSEWAGESSSQRRI